MSLHNMTEKPDFDPKKWVPFALGVSAIFYTRRCIRISSALGLVADMAQGFQCSGLLRSHWLAQP